MTEKTKIFRVSPVCQLPLMDDLSEKATKGDLAQIIYPEMTFDYAYPEPFINAMMDKVLPEEFFPRWEAISLAYRRVFSFGIVWGYPEGSVSGYPAPLTLNAYRLVRHYFEYYGDYSDDYYDLRLVEPDISLHEWEVDKFLSDASYNPITKSAIEVVTGVTVSS